MVYCMPLYISPSFRQGLPESRLQRGLELTIPGLDTRFPAGMTVSMYNDEGLLGSALTGAFGQIARNERGQVLKQSNILNIYCHCKTCPRE